MTLVELAPNWWEPRFDFLKGLLAMAEPASDYNQVEEYFEKSISADEMAGAVVPAAQTRYYLAHVFSHKGEKSQSRQILTELCDQFESWDIQVWHKKCAKALDAF